MKSLRLGERIAEELTRRIRLGEWLPGDQLPPERQLAEMCGVSRSTLLQALDALVSAGMIEKVHGSGNFVSRHREIRMALVYPETEFVCSVPLTESVFFGMELQRGIFAEAARRGVQTVLFCIAEPKNREALQSAIARLQEFDGILFFSQQLRSLRLALAATRPVVCHGPIGADAENRERCSSVNLNWPEACENLLDRLTASGREELLIAGKANAEFKREIIIGLATAAERRHFPCRITEEPPEKVLTGKLHNAAVMIVENDRSAECYRLIRQRGLELGRKFDLIFHASGVTLQNLEPAPIRIDKPYAEIGRRMMALACRLAASGGPPEHLLLPAEII